MNAAALKAEPGLSDVPETMLWTLYSRASEAMRPGTGFPDPKAVEIYNGIDYDYRRSFGRPNPFAALRARAFDLRLSQRLEAAPSSVIVNLGEGLETQRYRVSAPDALWLSVELPESIAVRERFIPPDRKHRHLALSALDSTWLDAVPAGKPVILSAQGLLMYLRPREVQSLMRMISSNCDCWSLMFDSVPAFVSRASRVTGGLPLTPHYRVPPMPWGVQPIAINALMRRWLGRHVAVRHLPYPAYPRGPLAVISRWLPRVPGSRFWMPALTEISHGFD